MGQPARVTRTEPAPSTSSSVNHEDHGIHSDDTVVNSEAEDDDREDSLAAVPALDDPPAAAQTPADVPSDVPTHGDIPSDVPLQSTLPGDVPQVASEQPPETPTSLPRPAVVLVRYPLKV